MFQRNYLGMSQNGARPIEFPNRFVAPSNTGIASGKDFDNNGQAVTVPGSGLYGNDAGRAGHLPPVVEEPLGPPIEVGRGERVHFLVSHPTPPVFDGPEDRNGTRNHDEIRFWADYVTPGAGRYIYDDRGRRGGLGRNEHFVIAGDQNADPFDGDSTQDAVLQLLDNPRITRP